MINSILYVSISRVVIILSQLVFIFVFSKNLSVESLGVFSLSVAIITPVVCALFFDSSAKVISDTLESNNIFVIVSPNLFVLSLFIIVLYTYDSYADITLNMIVLFLVFVLKVGEVISEIEFSYLRKYEKFRQYSTCSSVRFLTVYSLGSVFILLGFDFISVLTVLSTASLCFAFFSIYKLKGHGYYFNVDIKAVLEFVSRNKILGFAAGIKYFSSNLIRYFVVFKFGVITLGYLTPVFYGLSALSSVSTVFENVLSPRILKKIKYKDDDLVICKNKKELLVVFLTFLMIILSTVLFSRFYYSLFFPEIAFGYHKLLIVFSLGWIFYVFRGVLKIISYKFALQNLQLFVQLVFMSFLVFLMFILTPVFGVFGVALAFVASSIAVCVFYWYVLRFNIILK